MINANASALVNMLLWSFCPGGGGQRCSSSPSAGWRRDGEREHGSPRWLSAGGHLPGEELPQDPDPGCSKVQHNSAHFSLSGFFLA